MRWLQAGVAILSVVALTGCPSEFGKDGRVSKAVRKDSQDLAITRCTDQRKQEVCGNGKHNTPECQACLN